MTDLDEQLSRLWSDDLPPAQAERLRQRILTEPDTAARWARLDGALAALAELPATMPAPAVAAVRAPSRGWRAGLPWLAAAAAALALWSWPTARPERVLVTGTEWIEGEAALLAGDVEIEVDGRVAISVEPRTPVARGVGVKEDPMSVRSNVLALGAGAVVTVVVYEGSAQVWGRAGAPVLVTAGQTHTVSPEGGPPATPQAATPEARQERLTRLEAELEAAKQAVAAAQFEGAISRGQLALLQGKPSEWPADVAKALEPERFRRDLEAKLAELPNAELSEVDCAEYPCLAAIRFTGTGDANGWDQQVGDAVRTWLSGADGPEHLSLSLNNSRFQSGEERTQYLVFGAHGSEDQEVATRTEYRLDAMVDELGARLAEHAP